jgi:alkylated DNA repair dioxygenase AlkB
MSDIDEPTPTPAPAPESKLTLKIKATIKPIKPVFGKQTITITYGECAENHAGMQKIGSMAKKGLSLDDLKLIERQFSDSGYVTELIMLGPSSGVQGVGLDAGILIVRNGVSKYCNPDSFYREQAALDVDKKAMMRGRVVNKHARYNLCFDDQSQEPDYEAGKGRVVPFSEVPCTMALRQGIGSLHIPALKEVKAEGNYYYDVTKCGIGFHGDAERKIVVAARLGHSMSLHYWWYHRYERVGERVQLELHHGDIYFMSEKATGYDWKRPSIYTLRHAAGCSKFTA